MPKKLSAFRIFRTGTSEPVDALLPYTLHTPLFSDYAEKHRLIWVPPGQQASVAADGHIAFPVGSLIVKRFGLPENNGGRPVETRLLLPRPDGWPAPPNILDAECRHSAKRRVGTGLGRTY